MTTPKKTLCTVRTFLFKNKACNPICKLLNTIYEHYIDKQELKGILNIVSGVKYQFFCLFGNMLRMLQTLWLSIYCLIP